jgi:tetratricopeptide (TPR) repeat protein
LGYLESERDAFASVMELARQAYRERRIEDAEKLCLEAHTLQPSALEPKLTLGVLKLKKGDAGQAAELLDEVLRDDPRLFEALIWRSHAARLSGDFDGSVAFSKRALAVRPRDPQALNDLGLGELGARRPAKAEIAFRRALEVTPNNPRLHHNLGLALVAQGRNGAAAGAFSKAVSLDPSRFESVLSLGNVLLDLSETRGAVECGRRAVALAPRSIEAHVLLCGALVDAGRGEEAGRHLDEAISLDREHANSFAIGMRLQAVGRIEEAARRFRRDLEHRPEQGGSYYWLTQCQKIGESDLPLVDAMLALAREHRLPPTEAEPLEYGLGKALEDLGDYEQSMRHYDEANRIAAGIKLADRPFDREAHRRWVDKMVELFPERYERADADRSPLPILIVGMMRSGTTLVEQIISSHRDVTAAGELQFWVSGWRPEQGLTSSVSERLRDDAEAYLDLLRSIGPDALRVTDKMPANYLVLGAIHQALPEARIIHVRRDALDTCLSIYTTRTKTPVDFAHDRGSIAYAYRQYERCMDHWRRFVPEDRLLQIDYEDLVRNQEQTTRLMVAFCGLEWDEACLFPERSRRSVATPSSVRVRQPVNGSSIERWRRFEPWLGELLDLRLPARSSAFLG